MLQDKKSETDAERQKVILTRMVEELSREQPDLYYQSTSQIAQTIQARVAEGKTLNGDERKLMDGLTARDISVILSLH